jgi:LPXTG-motif cell wall-anchored protein
VYKVPGAGGVVGGGAGLATTGADVAWWIAFGIVTLLAGLFLLRTSRRRHAVAAASAGDSGR